jgi:4-aminobutyrate aminotransferase-like enzyme
MGSTLTLTPPLVTTVAEMDKALEVLEACLEQEQAGSS